MDLSTTSTFIPVVVDIKSAAMATPGHHHHHRVKRAGAPAATPGGAKTRRAPLPPPRALRGAAVHELSVVAAFDELARNAAMLQDGAAEEAMLKLVRRTGAWAKRWRDAEVARRDQAAIMREKDRELLAKEYKIKQARKIVEDERKGRMQAEAERDVFAKQVGILV